VQSTQKVPWTGQPPSALMSAQEPLFQQYLHGNGRVQLTVVPEHWTQLVHC
jgi:hypothetical protein